MTRISVVVPVFNAASTLTELVARISSAVAARSASHEIILVNDCSRDESWSIIRRLAETRPEVIGLDLSRNYGQQNALLTGVFAASGDVIVTIDDDLDYRPEDIPLLLDALDRNHDVAYGLHPTAAGGLTRRLASRLARWAVRQVSPYGMGGSSFRAFDATLRETFAHTSAPHASLDVLLSWSLARPTIVPLTSAHRGTRTRYGWRALVAVFASALTGFTIRPLHVAAWVGVPLLAVGTLGFVLSVMRTPLSNTGLILSTLVWLAGLQSLLIAAVGAYVGRIYFLSLRLPTPRIRERVGQATAARETVR